MGSSLPPAEFARRDSALFEKMKCIFFYCVCGNFGEVAGVFLAEEHSPDAGSEAPDAVKAQVWFW